MLRTSQGRLGFWATPLLLLSVSCSDPSTKTPPSPTGAPLGVQMTPRGAPSADPLLQFTEAYEDVRLGRFSTVQVAFEWGEIESYVGQRDWSTYEIHRGKAHALGVPLSFELLLLDNQARGRLPADIDTMAWGNPRLVIRLSAFLKDLLGRGDVAHLWLGRSADVYFLQNPGELPGFLSMLRTCRDSLASGTPYVPIGTIVDYGNLADAGRLGMADTLAAATDLLGLGVFGWDHDYHQVLDPAATVARVDAAVRRFHSTSVLLCEVGYAGDMNSPSDQEAFARLFTTYLEAPPPNLTGAIWFCLNDYHSLTASERADRLLGGEPVRRQNYVGQLTRLGLKSVDGSLKPAWLVVREWNLSRSETKGGGLARGG